MQKFINFLLLLFVLWGCGNKHKKNEYPAIDVTGYIKGQIKILDSIPYGILKITETPEGKSDSSYLKKDALNKLVSPFLSSEISQSMLETEYEEKVFADAGAEKVNITYDARNNESTIHQVVVYINPATGNISLLYITGFFEESGRIVKKQLLWNHNKGFQIISVIDPASNASTSLTEKIIWQ